MHHLTLLTGHTRESPRSEVADHVIEAMRPWLAPGPHRLAQVPGGYSPWCAVALRLVAPATSDWLGDFERCLAWTYLEDRK